MRRALLVASCALSALGALVRPVAAAEPPSRYIVVLLESAGPVAQAASRAGEGVFRLYHHALRGYAARLTAADAHRLRAAPGVAAVIPDRRMHAATTQEDATWGLDRIDQAALPRDGTFTFTRTGAGVTAYVIDTGIRATHREFEGRVKDGVDFVNGGPAGDCNGHGTHVAGTLGGSTYGVAKDVTLVPVRVLDCTGGGWLSDILDGIDWVTGEHAAGESAVANMSLGGPASGILNQAVKESIADGVTYVVAAGNHGEDACDYSPARVGPAITVSAVNKRDDRVPWANYGPCVDLFAPGRGITSAWATGDSAVRTISGTSMAAPHAAGVAALYLESEPTARPAAVREALYELTTKFVVGSAKSANKHLLFTNL